MAIYPACHSHAHAHLVCL